VQWAKREHFDVRMLNEWHSKINERIINVLKRKKPVHRKLQVLKNRGIFRTIPPEICSSPRRQGE
jgi:hypothetical protein